MSSLFISGGWLIDPERSRSFPADVLIVDGVIAGFTAPCSHCPEGARLLDARGCFVCPGFIDPHGHIDGHARTGMLSLLQGITTSIGGNCGFSPVDMASFLRAQAAFPIHQAEQVGMCALREAAGAADPFAPADEQQIEAMCALCRRALEDGAVGVSLGPAYAPGASMAEMTALCRVAAAYARPVSIDTRMHSMTDLHSLEEAIELARISGCTMIVSHFVYQYGVGVEDEALAMISRARAEGIDMQLDSGMYKDWCSSVGSALFEEHNMTDNSIGYDHLLMITGEHIGEQPDAQLLHHLRTAHPHDAVVVRTGLQEAVYTIARHPLTMISTDAGAYSPGEGHPQIAGSFPRFLREMVRERGEVSWEDAIRRITLLPAQVFSLSRKGRMTPGCDADLVIFTPKTIRDRADYPGIGRPAAAPEGIEAVIVGGRIAALRGQIVDAGLGRPVIMNAQ